MGRNSGRKSVEDDSRSSRPIRQATQKTPAWEGLIPKLRKPKEDGKGGESVKKKTKSKETARPPPPSAASQFRALDINTNTSEDEAVEKESAASKKTSKKSMKTDNAEQSPEPTATKKGKTRRIVEESSSSESDSRPSEDDDDEQSLSPSSGLEELEKKPGALKAKFESERPAWVDDHLQVPDGDDDNLWYDRLHADVRDQFQSDLQDDAQDDAQGVQDTQDTQDAQDDAGSPSRPDLGSIPGSPARSHSRAGPTTSSSPEQYQPRSQSRPRPRPRSRSHSRSRSRSHSRSRSRSHSHSRLRSRSRSQHPVSRTAQSKPDSRSHEHWPPISKHARDDPSEDEGMMSEAPPARKKGKKTHVSEEGERREKASKVKENKDKHRARAERDGRGRSREKERARELEKKEKERERELEEKRERERELERREKEWAKQEQVRKCRAREEETREEKAKAKAKVKEQTRNQRVCKRDGILDRGSSDDEHEQDRKRAKQQEKVNTGEKTRAKERNQRMHGQGAARTGSSHVAKERGRPRERPSSARQGSRRKRVDENPRFLSHEGSDNDSSSDDASPHPAPKRQRRHRGQDVDDNDDDEDPCIDIVWYGSNRPNLTDQHPRVYRVVRRTIRECEPNVCLLNAFPDEDGNFARPVLIKHAAALGYVDMAKKLKSNKETDEFYYRKLCTIASQRVNLIRGKVKKACQRQVKTVYGLTVGDSEKVGWLLDGIAYIFPHNYQDRTVVGEEAFSAPIFEDMLSDTFFSKKNSFGFRIVSHFTSSDLQNPDEKEIPAAMLALISTAIYASIEDYKHAPYEAGKFEVNSYLHVYKQNIAVLDDIKTGNPEAYHTLLHGLYTRIVGGNARSISKKSYLNVAGMSRR